MCGIMVSKRQLVKGKRIFMGVIALHCIISICFFFLWDASPIASVTLWHRGPNVLNSFASLYQIIEYTVEHSNTKTSLGDIRRLFNRERIFCQGNFIGCCHLFAVLFNVNVNPDKGHGRKGGENITDVLNQTEESEYFKLDSGYFGLNCSENVVYQFINECHLNEWVEKLTCLPGQSKSQMMVSNWTIAVTRYEYANFYHTMTDFYNTFLLVKILQIDLEELNILWIDGHPKGALDSSWRTLFGKVIRAGELTKTTVFSKMVWGVMGYNSLIEQHDLLNLPFVEDFRHFFLSRHGVTDTHKQDCKNLRVLFIWRRDYLAHPRNPGGKVARKIENEEELISAVRTVLPEHSVIGIQIDKLSMDKQLELIANTDILIGIHGAGLSHTLFLPQTSGLIELFPTGFSMNRHFRAMAQWRNLQYLAWENSYFDTEDGNYNTVVDTTVVAELVEEMYHILCNRVQSVKGTRESSHLTKVIAK